MNPGMGEKKRKESDFAEHLDDVLAGKEAGTGDVMDEEYRANIDFSSKVIECRGEPSAALIFSGIQEKTKGIFGTPDKFVKFSISIKPSA